MNVVTRFFNVTAIQTSIVSEGVSACMHTHTLGTQLLFDSVKGSLSQCILDKGNKSQCDT